jgi:hypothetical protein
MNTCRAHLSTATAVLHVSLRHARCRCTAYPYRAQPTNIGGQDLTGSLEVLTTERPESVRSAATSVGDTGRGSGRWWWTSGRRCTCFRRARRACTSCWGRWSTGTAREGHVDLSGDVIDEAMSCQCRTQAQRGRRSAQRWPGGHGRRRRGQPPGCRRHSVDSGRSVGENSSSPGDRSHQSWGTVAGEVVLAADVPAGCIPGPFPVMAALSPSADRPRRRCRRSG